MNFDFDRLSGKETQDLFKSLSTGDFAKVGGIDNQKGGSALIPESLEATLRTLTYTEKQLKLWSYIPKKKAYSTVEEYNVVNSYGDAVSAFQREGIAGLDTTADYSREYNKVKCLTTTRSITHLMDLVRTVEDPQALEVLNGTRFILGQAEESLYFGDSSLAPAGEEGLEWDGIVKQAENSLDLRGQHLEDIHLNSAVETVLNNYGIPNKVYMPINTAAVFSENYYPDQRAIMNANPGQLTAGLSISKFNSVGGTVDIDPALFMRRGLVKLNPKQVAVGKEIPTAPTIAVEEEDKEGSKMEKGTYKYAVIAVSSTGISAPVLSDAAASTGEGKALKLTITNAANQVYAPDFFIIYRTEKDKEDFYEIARIGAKSRDNSEVTEFIDENQTLPNTGIAILGDFTEESLAFKQLLPLFKLDFAMTGPMRRFGIFLYGTPQVYAPKRFVVIKNIKSVRG